MQSAQVQTGTLKKTQAATQSILHLWLLLGASQRIARQGSAKIVLISPLSPSLNYLRLHHCNNGSVHHNGQLENSPKGGMEAAHQLLLTV